jgi:hypothetical protein
VGVGWVEGDFGEVRDEGLGGGGVGTGVEAWNVSGGSVEGIGIEASRRRQRGEPYGEGYTTHGARSDDGSRTGESEQNAAQRAAMARSRREADHTVSDQRPPRAIF